VEAEEVLVDEGVAHHLLALLGGAQRGDLVAEAGGALEVERRRGVVHAALEILAELGAAPPQKEGHVPQLSGSRNLTTFEDPLDPHRLNQCPPLFVAQFVDGVDRALLTVPAPVAASLCPEGITEHRLPHLLGLHRVSADQEILGQILDISRPPGMAGAIGQADKTSHRHHQFAHPVDVRHRDVVFQLHDLASDDHQRQHHHSKEIY